MKSQANRQVRLKSRPTGIPQADNFEIVTAALPDIADRQFLIRNEYLSVEPAMRGWVSAVANYSTPVGIGEVMRADSRHKDARPHGLLSQIKTGASGQQVLARDLSH